MISSLVKEQGIYMAMTTNSELNRLMQPYTHTRHGSYCDCAAWYKSTAHETVNQQQPWYPVAKSLCLICPGIIIISNYS